MNLTLPRLVVVSAIWSGCPRRLGPVPVSSQPTPTLFLRVDCTHRERKLYAIPTFVRCSKKIASITGVLATLCRNRSVYECANLHELLIITMERM